MRWCYLPREGPLGVLPPLLEVLEPERLFLELELLSFERFTVPELLRPLLEFPVRPLVLVSLRPLVVVSVRPLLELLLVLGRVTVLELSRLLFVVPVRPLVEVSRRPLVVVWVRPLLELGRVVTPVLLVLLLWLPLMALGSRELMLPGVLAPLGRATVASLELL